MTLTAVDNSSWGLASTEYKLDGAGVHAVHRAVRRDRRGRPHGALPLDRQRRQRRGHEDADGQDRPDRAGDDRDADADPDRRLVLAADGRAAARWTGRSARASRRSTTASTAARGRCTPAPFFIATFGPHTLDYRATDVAGNVEATKTESWGTDFDAARAARRAQRLRRPARAREEPGEGSPAQARRGRQEARQAVAGVRPARRLRRHGDRHRPACTTRS